MGRIVLTALISVLFSGLIGAYAEPVLLWFDFDDGLVPPGTCIPNAPASGETRSFNPGLGVTNAGGFGNSPCLILCRPASGETFGQWWITNVVAESNAITNLEVRFKLYMGNGSGGNAPVPNAGGNGMVFHVGPVPPAQYKGSASSWGNGLDVTFRLWNSGAPYTPGVLVSYKPVTNVFNPGASANVIATNGFLGYFQTNGSADSFADAVDVHIRLSSGLLSLDCSNHVIGMVHVYTNLVIPGFAPIAPVQFAFTASDGAAAHADCWIDNVRIEINPPQTNPPVVTAVGACGNSMAVTVRYSAPMNPTGVTNAANYSVRTLSGQWLPVIDAWLAADQLTTTLRLGVGLQPGTNYILCVSNVHDVAGNLLWPNPTCTNFVFAGSFVELPVAPGPWPWGQLLANQNATLAAQALMAALAADYGQHTWLGLKLTNDIPYIYTNTGRKPVIIEGDFMDYSPSRLLNGANPRNHTEKMIALEQFGHVLQMAWHWNAPTNLGSDWTCGFMSSCTTYDLSYALANTNSAEYIFLVRDIDAIAAQLRKFAEVNIPVLWRPLHEADGAWFWWGAKGATAFKQLWRLLYERLTYYHGLNNLIWVYTPASSSKPEWYPGDDVVDIVGTDQYPSDPDNATLASTWNNLHARFAGKKLLALTEFGGVPNIELMHSNGVKWAYAVSWNATLVKSSLEALVRTYQSRRAITLDELNLVPPRFAGVERITGAGVSVFGTGPRGAAYRILTSRDAGSPLRDWAVFTNGVFQGGVFSTVLVPDEPQKFFVVSCP